ncbi:NAD-dependent epimerase/dehydratase family protein [Desulforhopalus sp. 52FAK]
MNNTIAAGTKVMVTGATGFTGKVLVRKLLEQGLVVNAIARQSSNIKPFDGQPVNWFRGEVFDEATIRSAMEGVEYVFHVAAAFREAKSTEQDYRNVHVVSTQLIVQEARKNPEFKRLVHVSTMGVHGHIQNPPGNEESAFSPGDDYQSTKVEAEDWLKAFTKTQDFPYAIIRPCAIYGPGERRLLKLFKMAAGKVFPILGKGKCWYHLVHVEDLANAIILAATEEKALGEAFIIGATEPIRLEDMAAIIAKEYDTRLKVLRLPIGPFFLMGDICEVICRPFKIEPPIYRRRVAFYSKDRNFSTKKMQEVLGYQPLWSNEDGIIESARWYLKENWLQLKK